MVAINNSKGSYITTTTKELLPPLPEDNQNKAQEEELKTNKV